MQAKQSRDYVKQLYAFYLRKTIWGIMGTDAVDAPKLSEGAAIFKDFHQRIPTHKGKEIIDLKTFFKFIAHDMLGLTPTRAGATIATPHVDTLNIYASVIERGEHAANLELQAHQVLDYYFFERLYTKNNSAFIEELQHELFSYKYNVLFPYMLDIKSLYKKIVLEQHNLLGAETALAIINSNTQKLYLADVLRLIFELHLDKRGEVGAQHFAYRFFIDFCDNEAHILSFIELGIHELITFYYLGALLVIHNPLKSNNVLPPNAEAAYRRLMHAILDQLQVALMHNRRIVVNILHNAAPNNYINLQKDVVIEYFISICESGVALRGLCVEVGSNFSLENPTIWNVWLGFFMRLLHINAREAEKGLLQLLRVPAFFKIASRPQFGQLVLRPFVERSDRHIWSIARFYKQQALDIFMAFSNAQYFGDITNLN